MDQVIGSDAHGGEVKHADWVARARLATGLAYGIGLWLLTEAAKVPVLTDAQIAHHVVAMSWAQAHPFVFAAVTAAVLFLPLVIIAELERMRPIKLTTYAALAGATLSALAVYSLWRAPELVVAGGSLTFSKTTANPFPSFQFLVVAGPSLFIVNQLLEHRARGRALFADYSSYFEDSWMRGAQFLLANAFAGLVIIVLNLGGALFDLIKISLFSELIHKAWVSLPVYGAAFAAAVHITDVRPALVRGARNLGLTLLGWITPLMTLIGGGFLATLLFTGLAPLWATRHAATLLLNAAVVMLLAINAAYKDGDPQSHPPSVVRWAGQGGAVVMLAFAGIAAYAIHLRVAQYGWTQSRVHAAALNAILMAYSIGYVWATFRSPRWMQEIERVNVAASLGVIAVAFALFTPIADPARIAVDSQMERLSSHEVKPNQFDFQLLRFRSGRFGGEALNRLIRSDRPDVRDRALRVAVREEPWLAEPEDPPLALKDPPLSHAVIFPKGAVFPKGFLEQHWDLDGEKSCLTSGVACEIYIVEQRNSRDPVLVVYTPRTKRGVADDYVLVINRDSAGKWFIEESHDISECPDAVAALRAGRYSIEPSKAQVLLLGNVRIQFGERPDASCRPSETDEIVITGSPR